LLFDQGVILASERAGFGEGQMYQERCHKRNESLEQTGESKFQRQPLSSEKGGKRNRIFRGGREEKFLKKDDNRSLSVTIIIRGELIAEVSTGDIPKEGKPVQLLCRKKCREAQYFLERGTKALTRGGREQNKAFLVGSQSQTYNIK